MCLSMLKQAFCNGWLCVYIVTGLAAVSLQSIIPILLIGGPRFYGAWHFNITGFLQHGGQG